MFYIYLIGNLLLYLALQKNISRILHCKIEFINPLGVFTVTNYADSFETFADFQKQAFEPARRFGGVAIATFETVARKNYALLGDVVEFAVEQAKLPTESDDAKDLFERQLATARAFGEQLTARAGEYAEIAKGLQASAQAVINGDFVEPAKKATKKTTKKTTKKGA